MVGRCNYLGRTAGSLPGAELASSFRSEKLISEYHVSIIPVLLGAGIPLFTAPGPREDLKLLGTEAYASGIVQLRYGR